MMPRPSELRRANRYDLADAVIKAGGFWSVAQLLGLKLHVRPPGYWKDFENVERDIKEFINQHGLQGYMPSRQEFIQAGEGAIWTASIRHGGVMDVSRRLGLSITPSQKRLCHFWHELENIRAELSACAEEVGLPGIMPTRTELAATGRHGLLHAIYDRFGGDWRAVATSAGLQVRLSVQDYVDHPDLLEQSLGHFVDSHGMPGSCPHLMT